ncbi:MAG TPA: hypothetical protein VK575_11785 [Gemmatimonadaceae bacterium]|nr:hypothetical protein [Gemmatimonadaceae bacterium]
MVTTALLGTTVSMGLDALRQRLALALIANRSYEQEITSQKRFATVNIAIPSAITARDVVPDVVPPAVPAITPTSIALTLSQWKEAPFAMDDKGLIQVNAGILPAQASEGIKAVANAIETFLWTLHVKSYGYAGVAGTTPFATDLSAYLDARRIANNQLMDMDPRFMIINTDAEASALGLRAFQDASFRGDTMGITKGIIGEKLGALWLMSQLTASHTAGTYAGTGTPYEVNNGAGYPIGTKTITVDGGALGTMTEGDIIKFKGLAGVTGHAQTYTVVSTVGGATITSITFEPGLVAAVVDNEDIEAKTTHVLNSLIHRDAIAFAMAPLLETLMVPGTLQAVAIDEISGLSLRLEVSRQHKQTQWSWDALYGGAVPRPEFWVRLAG